MDQGYRNVSIDRQGNFRGIFIVLTILWIIQSCTRVHRLWSTSLPTKRLSREQQDVVIGAYLTNVWATTLATGSTARVIYKPSIQMVWKILTRLYPNITIGVGSLRRCLAAWKRQNRLLWILAHQGERQAAFYMSKLWCQPQVDHQPSDLISQGMVLLTDTGVIFQGIEYAPVQHSAETYLRWMQALARGELVPYRQTQNREPPLTIEVAMDDRTFEEFVVQTNRHLSVVEHQTCCYQVLEMLGRELQDLQTAFADAWLERFKAPPCLHPASADIS